jgi:hypothetical protein
MVLVGTVKRARVAGSIEFQNTQKDGGSRVWATIVFYPLQPTVTTAFLAFELIFYLVVTT